LRVALTVRIGLYGVYCRQYLGVVSNKQICCMDASYRSELRYFDSASAIAALNALTCDQQSSAVLGFDL